MTRPEFIQAGSYTAKAFDELEAAIADNNERAIALAYDRITKTVNMMGVNISERDEAIIEYLDAVLEAHYEAA